MVIGGFLDLDFSPPFYKAWFHDNTGDSRILDVSVGDCDSFIACRRRVLDALDKAYPSADPIWTTEVDVVGASLGGLVGRYCAAPSDDPAHPRRLRIAHLYTIASPHSGSTLAQVIALTQFHRDVRPGSPFLQKLAATDAQARYQLIPYVRLGDEAVGAQYAAPPGMNPYWLPYLPPAHAGAMADVRILADIARRLRGETPFTKPPPSPLPPNARS